MKESTLEGKLVLVVNGDWCTVEKAERICDADVEGTLPQMADIARAIRARGESVHRRCAVDATGDRVLFWSPRNSQIAAAVTLEAADDLAAQIETLN